MKFNRRVAFSTDPASLPRVLGALALVLAMLLLFAAAIAAQPTSQQHHRARHAHGQVRHVKSHAARHKPANRPFSLQRVVGQNLSTVERYLGKPIKTLPQQYYVFKGRGAVVEVIASFDDPKVRPGYRMWDMAVVFRRQLTLQQALKLTGLRSARCHFSGGNGISYSYDGLRVVGAPLMQVSMLSQEGLKTISPPRLFISVPGHP
ncbi:MAG: hypothetical protein KGJ62_13875 [Armatimonadetes bacterium]|nr:hypothetical protein [Armatimonadota bacterium]MDE2206373.1 hypothetical protein [Armatimonadota bacterium]